MGATKEQAEKTRQDLLNAALITFSKNGFNSTRLEDISKQAGVTRGAFYGHFKNKTEVFCELYRFIMIDLQNRMHDAISEIQSPLLKLENLLRTIIMELISDEYAKRCGKIFFSVEYTPEVVSALKQIKLEMGYPIRTLITEIVNEGKQVKEIRDNVTAESVFLAAISILVGMAEQILDSLFPISENDVKTIVNIFIEGIKNRSKN